MREADISSDAAVLGNLPGTCFVCKPFRCRMSVCVVFLVQLTSALAWLCAAASSPSPAKRAVRVTS
jgi:hypothetical protein